MSRQLLNQYNMLALFDCDRSNWEDLRHFPDTVTCRRMLRFADWAAKYPKQYEAALRCYILPELSLREIANIMQTAWTTFRKRMEPVYVIDDPEDFSFLELDCNELLAPSVPAAPTVRGKSETFRNAIALADFAHNDQTKWQVIRAYYTGNNPTQKELAELYRISQATVSRYLESVNTITNIKEINTEYL